MGFAPCCDFYFHSKVQPFIFRAIGHFIHLRCDSPYFLSGPDALLCNIYLAKFLTMC